MSDDTEKRMKAFADQIQTTTQVNVCMAYEEDGREWPGYFHLYTEGMVSNFDLPDVELRFVHGIFANEIGWILNAFNSWRLRIKDDGMDDYVPDAERIVHLGEDYKFRVTNGNAGRLQLIASTDDVEWCSGCQTKHIPH